MKKMTLQLTEVKTYKQYWLCDENGCSGEMIYDNMCFDCCPAYYQHKCDKCGRLDTSEEIYPRVTQI